jgi:DNA-binding transcriptional LysR family regulator
VKDRFARDYYPMGMNQLPRPLQPLESRPLRYFVAVAEELNFTRGAERLGIAGPALSRAIAQLETQLGTQLLERSTRRVALTEAGEVLLDQARLALEALDAAGRRAQRAAVPGRPLVLALKADLDGNLLEPSAEAYRREHPERELELRFCRFGEQSHMLRDGSADVALLYTPFDDRGLDFEPLLQEPQLAAIAAEHPLAARPAVGVADLEREFVRTSSPNLWQPRQSRPGPLAIVDISQLLKMVELGQLVALLPSSVTERYLRPGIAYRPVTGVPPATLAVAWPSDSTSLATAAYVRVVSELAGEAALLNTRAGPVVDRSA